MPNPFVAAVVVAAGSSSRMGGADKLDADLLGRSLLQWSVEAMASANTVREIVLVARPDRLDRLSGLPWLRDVRVVPGGAERSDSVRTGVEAARSATVLVHDAARPLATPELVDAVARAAQEHGAAAPVLPVVDSLKRVLDGRLESVERAGLYRSQTPQGARRELLLEAFDAAGGERYTDEAALLESRGVRVATVPGEAANLKVTEPEDLDLVRAIASSRGSEQPSPRIGLGEDSHGFGPGDGLWLGGVLIEEAPRLHGHSDGDVALHALATAILSACGLGDLGGAYPADGRTPSGIASTEMLTGVLGRATDAGWRVDRAQISLTGARPRLGRRMDEMRSRIAQLLDVSTDSVALVASTGNLSGPEGAGRTLTARALVTVVRR